MRAIQNVRRICEEHLKGLYDLEIVDIYKNLPLARDDQIIAAEDEFLATWSHDSARR